MEANKNLSEKLYNIFSTYYKNDKDLEDCKDNCDHFAYFFDELKDGYGKKYADIYRNFSLCMDMALLEENSVDKAEIIKKTLFNLKCEVADYLDKVNTDKELKCLKMLNYYNSLFIENYNDSLTKKIKDLKIYDNTREALGICALVGGLALGATDNMILGIGCSAIGFSTIVASNIYTKKRIKDFSDVRNSMSN